MKTQSILLLALMGISTFTVAGSAEKTDASAVKTAVIKYLSEHGDLCVGKFDWPIDVSASDAEAMTRDAVQMPVLEKLGLVSASEGTAVRKSAETEVTVPVKRYALTEKGKKFYLSKQTINVLPDGKKVVHQGDFCAGKLSLDKIISWESVKSAGKEKEVNVTYTYKIAPAEWAKKPEAQQVFPMVGQIVNGAGKLQLQQSFSLASNGWVAVNPQ